MIFARDKILGIFSPFSKFSIVIVINVVKDNKNTRIIKKQEQNIQKIYIEVKYTKV